jgi:hypothetical protein
VILEWERPVNLQVLEPAQAIQIGEVLIQAGTAMIKGELGKEGFSLD